MHWDSVSILGLLFFFATELIIGKTKKILIKAFNIFVLGKIQEKTNPNAPDIHQIYRYRFNY